MMTSAPIGFISSLQSEPKRVLPRGGLHSFSRSVARSFSRLGGVSLMETIMAVAVGGVVASAGTVALTRYAEGSRVDSAAEQMVSYAAATELWLTDNYESLRGVTAGSSATRVSATVLEPYLGAPVRTDAFRHTYEIAVRRYNYTTPKAGGGVTTRTAVQAALLARGGDGTLVQKPEMRARIAAKAGAPIGYVATAAVSCDNPATGAPLASGSLCGSFGAYAVNNAALPAAERFPAAAITGATLVAMSTVGDTAMEDKLGLTEEAIRPGQTSVAHEEMLVGFGQHIVDIPKVCLANGVVVNLVMPKNSANALYRSEPARVDVLNVNTVVKPVTYLPDPNGGGALETVPGSVSQSFSVATHEIGATFAITRVADEWRVRIDPDSKDFMKEVGFRFPQTQSAQRYAMLAPPTFVSALNSATAGSFWGFATRDGTDGKRFEVGAIQNTANYGFASSPGNFHPENIHAARRFVSDIDFLRDIPADKTVRQHVQVVCSMAR